MDKETIDIILQDIGLESVTNIDKISLPPPDKDRLNSIMIDLGLESIQDDNVPTMTEVNKSCK
ncbi:MAG: hypothetical protein GYA42_09760 [Syntrophomonadaceae bacterium]|nr:hypothetical protein [Syntrophomonadaceae bacterium]